MKTALVALPLGLLMFIANLDSIGFVTSGVVGLFGVILIPLAGLALIVIGLARRDRARLSGGAILLVAAITAHVASAFVVDRQQEASMRRGDRLCAALERFRTVAGSYPPRLEDLVPQYTSEIPSSSMGVFKSIPFRYVPLHDGVDYRLGFESVYLVFCRRGPGLEWRCGN